ncbi:unnamed protein product, partial [Staurois parvus]
LCIPVHFFPSLFFFNLKRDVHSSAVFERSGAFLMHFTKFQYSSVQKKCSMFCFFFCNWNALEQLQALM